MVGVLLISLAVCVAVAIIGGVLVAIVMRKLKQSRNELDTVLAQYTDDFEEARSRAHGRAADIDDAVKDMHGMLSASDAEMHRGVLPAPASETTTIALGGERRVSSSQGVGRLGRGRGGSGYGRVGDLEGRDAE